MAAVRKRRPDPDEPGSRPQGSVAGSVEERRLIDDATQRRRPAPDPGDADVPAVAGVQRTEPHVVAQLGEVHCERPREPPSGGASTERAAVEEHEAVAARPGVAVGLHVERPLSRPRPCGIDGLAVPLRVGPAAEDEDLVTGAVKGRSRLGDVPAHEIGLALPRLPDDAVPVEVRDGAGIDTTSPPRTVAGVEDDHGANPPAIGS